MRSPRDLMLLALGSGLALAACGPCGYNTYAEARSTLSGRAVVPAVDSPYAGEIETLSVAHNEGSFPNRSLSLRMTTSLPTAEVTAVHLHAGDPGEIGPVIFTVPEDLYRWSDTLAVYGGADYEGDLPIDELLELIRTGSAYVDVHTHTRPEGELRGQLDLVSFEDRSEVYCS